MEISPKVSFYVTLGIAVMTLLAGGSVTLPVGIPPEWGAYFVSWDVFVLKIWAVIAPLLHGYAAPSAGGPLTSTSK